MTTSSNSKRKLPGKKTTRLMVWTDPILIPLWLAKWFTFKFLPTQALLSMARSWGSLHYRFKHKRKQVRKQLQAYYGQSKTPDEIEEISKRHFQYFQELKIARIWPQRRDFNTAKFDVEGRDYLDDALDQGHGAILLTIHFGYGRLIKHLLGRSGYDVTVVGNTSPNDELEGWSQFRYFFHTRLLRLPFFRAVDDNDLPTGINIRPIMRAIQSNKIIVMAADGRNASNFVSTTILGKKRTLATGSVSISIASGSPILPTFVVDSEHGASRLKLLIMEPLTASSEKGPLQVQEVIESFGRIIETVVEDYPHLQDWSRFKRWPNAPRQLT